MPDQDEAVSTQAESDDNPPPQPPAEPTPEDALVPLGDPMNKALVDPPPPQDDQGEDEDEEGNK